MGLQGSMDFDDDVHDIDSLMECVVKVSPGADSVTRTGASTDWLRLTLALCRCSACTASRTSACRGSASASSAGAVLAGPPSNAELLGLVC